jgi:hypothetical protein
MRSSHRTLGSSESLLNPLQINRLAFQCQSLTLQLVEERVKNQVLGGKISEVLIPSTLCLDFELPILHKKVVF